MTMWAYEADVVIVGFGGAGAAAALTASEAGASVLLLEKNGEGGGNTRYSGGGLRTYPDVESAITHIETLCEGTTTREVVATFVNESIEVLRWLRDMGADVVHTVNQVGRKARRYPCSLPLTAFPTIAGAAGIGPRVRIKGVGDAAGVDLWGLLSRKVASMDIKTLYTTPSKRLLFDKTAGVTGVVATHSGQDIRVRARRGVILASGGFEYAPAMHLDYLGQHYHGLCNPGNTGDGIRMAADIGADLWHMTGIAATLGYKFPDFPCAIRQALPTAGYVYVDQTGRRFMDEPGTDAHLTHAPTSFIDTRTLERLRIPSYVIFDEDTRTRGPVAATDLGKISDLYQWSADNSAEIKKGWISAADSISSLATKLRILPERLQTTIAQYNLNCVAGYDAEYGREAGTLIPIARPPYYAIEIWPSLFNTQGGPRRNSNAQILDVWGEPIKRLYGAGELGSLWNRNYPGAGNLAEALAFGRIAGRNAAREQPLTL